MIAELAEEYSDSILHVTTRQDIQLHYVHIDDTPDLMRRLAAVDITTREACGNGVRNVTACPLAGVCHTEAFDTTAYAAALFRFLLGHPDCQDFGRKFKPAFSGCAGEACGLVMMHDFGAIARTTVVDGVEKRAFDLYVGGGLGTTPHQAKLLYENHPVEELLPAVQAIARVFGRLGEKANRNRARIKFLVAKLGIDEFRRLVDEERTILPHDDRWTSYLPSVEDYTESPVREAVPAPAYGRPAARGLPRVAAHQRLPPAPGGLRRRDGRPAARRPQLGAGAQAGRRRPYATSATRCAPRSSRTSCCAGWPRATCPRSTRRWRTSTSRRPAPARSSTSPRAPAPTPASSASRLRAGSPASCARASPRRSSSSTRRSAACASR